MKSVEKGKIGFFDSGYGGLTVLNEVRHHLPQYDYLYLGDNKRAPYGEKTQEEVYQYTWEGVQYLLNEGCELIILACNTASAKALRRIQQNDLLSYPEQRVLGVIRPSAEVLGGYSQTNHILILGTQGTISSNTYLDEFSEFSSKTIVHQYACPKWVPIIEAGEHLTKEGKEIILADIQRFLADYPQIDIILLGCTHYPIIRDFIIQHIPLRIQVISQGEIVAESLKKYLGKHEWLDKKLSKNGKSTFKTTGDKIMFENQAKRIIGAKISVDTIILSTP